MDPFTIAAIGTSIYSGIKGAQAQGKADQMQKKALDQAEYQFNMTAPMRRQGLQALGQVEAPMNLGNLGFNAANPFAAARGPAPSTASYGDWGRMTTDPGTIDNAISGVTDKDLAWAQDALTAKRPDGSWVYKSSERNHAQKQIMDKANQRLGMSGAGTVEDAIKRRGIQPLNGAAEDAARNAGRFGWPAASTGRTANARVGIQPMGGGY